MATLKSPAYRDHPACQAYDGELSRIYYAWEDRHKDHVLKAPEEAALRAALDVATTEAREALALALAADGLTLVEGWVEAGWSMDLQTVST